MGQRHGSSSRGVHFFRPSNENETRRLFRSVDKDGNGVLTKKEFAIFAAELFKRPELYDIGKVTSSKKEFTRTLFELIDKDKSGTISYEEFRAFCLQEDLKRPNIMAHVLGRQEPEGEKSIIWNDKVSLALLDQFVTDSPVDVSSLRTVDKFIPAHRKVFFRVAGGEIAWSFLFYSGLQRTRTLNFIRAGTCYILPILVTHPDAARSATAALLELDFCFPKHIASPPPVHVIGFRNANAVDPNEEEEEKIEKEFDEDVLEEVKQSLNLRTECFYYACDVDRPEEVTSVFYSIFGRVEEKEPVSHKYVESESESY